MLDENRDIFVAVSPRKWNQYCWLHSLAAELFTKKRGWALEIGHSFVIGWFRKLQFYDLKTLKKNCLKLSKELSKILKNCLNYQDCKNWKKNRERERERDFEK